MGFVGLFQIMKVMTYTEIRILLANDSDVGREWWVDKFISTKDNSKEILWIGGYTLDNTIIAENSKGEKIEVFPDKTPLCVTFLGAILIQDLETLEKYWKDRIQIYEELKRNNKIMSIAKPPSTTFIGC